ncbi:hypothetical protein BDY21DRAFT_32182 [Lineolata rhizophorae]|uniref:Uncharacterized protein n=1 Tax=Lineolata rhizophorae TaxID=578093 RepID=A0A6A6NZR9_9PEZI|nr:hypothetical protein BDY21DRAFT_32182 [Lineolata rhizophorae]
MRGGASDSVDRNFQLRPAILGVHLLSHLHTLRNWAGILATAVRMKELRQAGSRSDPTSGGELGRGRDHVSFLIPSYCCLEISEIARQCFPWQSGEVDETHVGHVTNAWCGWSIHGEHAIGSSFLPCFFFKPFFRLFSMILLFFFLLFDSFGKWDMLWRGEHRVICRSLYLV